MAASLFTKLKKYAGAEISQDENYATELLASLLYELPGYRQFVLNELFQIPIAEEVAIRTQESYETRRFGRAVLDLVIEDDVHFIIVEVKVGAGLGTYRPQDDLNGDTYDQIQKYEDCIGLPEDKRISIFTLAQHTPKIRQAKYRYYQPDTDNITWYDLYRITNRRYVQLKDNSPEKYLLDHYIRFLKEENMAGFQGFTLKDLADMSRLTELTEMLSQHRELIKTRIKVEGFKASEEHLSWDRDGVFYNWRGPGKVGVFVGFWFSDEIYHFKFPRESGPRAMVFLEIPPQSPIRDQVIESEAYAKAGNTFDRKNVGYQVLLTSKPLTDFLGKEDQAGALLAFYQDNVGQLQKSGILDLILSCKPSKD
ncbi:hypothetical protein DRH29_04640 [candidate division Kazan bacterium]|uniref:PD-(D/E)XK nuclease superfamily protein n=1 Tax=candidate division Kazan bacterium TaxID=2202143 RepID=A0A420ZBI6_UNCK3|nr:MAG: hypothetical protein DRH29_04640 [candidate division Kazan bacterium]